MSDIQNQKNAYQAMYNAAISTYIGGPHAMCECGPFGIQSTAHHSECPRLLEHLRNVQNVGMRQHPDDALRNAYRAFGLGG